MDNIEYAVTTDPIDAVVEAFASGEPVVLLDHPDREGEADMILAAQTATGEKFNRMSLLARGLIAVGLTAQRLAELRIPLIKPVNCSGNWPHFAEPVDYRIGTTTGASAFDLAATAKALTDPEARIEDFARPGHLQLLCENEAGLRGRMGHTEGAVSLARLAGLYPATVICEMMDPDGRMAAGEPLRTIIQQNNLLVTTVQSIADTTERQSTRG
jgi:3,4-dihydroxy-2-butanone 4-phosphate synthase